MTYVTKYSRMDQVKFFRWPILEYFDPYTCIESGPLGYSHQQLIKILSSCLRKLDGCFFHKYGFRSELFQIISSHSLTLLKRAIPVKRIMKIFFQGFQNCLSGFLFPTAAKLAVSQNFLLSTV